MLVLLGNACLAPFFDDRKLLIIADLAESGGHINDRGESARYAPRVSQNNEGFRVWEIQSPVFTIPV